MISMKPKSKFNLRKKEIRKVLEQDMREETVARRKTVRNILILAIVATVAAFLLIGNLIL
jgi:hypothetical protein